MNASHGAFPSVLAMSVALLMAGSALGAEPASPARKKTLLPPDAVARLGSIRFLHGDWIHSLAFTPDGKTLVSGTHEPFFRTWDATTGREIRRFKVEGSCVDRLALSPDGRLVASSDHDGTLAVWDVVTGKQCFSRRFTHSYNAPVAWTPDGKIIAIAIGQSVIHLLKATEGETLRQFEKGPEEQIEQLVFSPDGKLLLSSGVQKSACVWDVARGKFLRTLEGNRDFTFCLALSPDGKRVAGRCTFCLWDVASGKKIRALPAWDVNCAAFSPDGKSVAAGCHYLLRLMDPATGKMVREWRAHEDHVTALAFSRDGKVLASGGADKRIHLWDPATGTELRPASGHRGKVQKVVFAPDGRTVVSGSLDRTIRFWEWTTGREWARGEDIGDYWGVSGLVYAPDGKSLASLESICDAENRVNKAVRLWDASTGKMISRHLTKGDDQIWTIAFLPDNKTLAVSLEDGIRFWEPATGKVLRRLGKAHKGIASLLLSPDGKSIAWASCEEYLGIRDLATGADRHTFKDARFTHDIVLAFSPDGAILAATGNHAPVSFWDVATGRKLSEWKKDEDTSTRGLAFSPDGTLVAAAVEREVRLWDLRVGKEVRRFTGHQGEVNAVAFAPDGQVLVSASDDGTLLVWDTTGRLQDGRLAAVALTPHELETQWTALGDTDAAKRWRAIWTLAACPRTTSFLSAKLRPIPVVAAERLKQLVADLDADAFAVREKASRQLAEIGEIAGPALREALVSNPSVEARRRIEALRKPLKQLDAVPLPEERLRALSGGTVLEYLGDKEARNLLQALANGAPQARLTREAKTALERVTKRTRVRP